LSTWALIDTSSALTGSSATISRPGQADTLPLAAGELVRVALDRVPRQPDLAQQLENPLLL
jgi:hypothetical protein